MSTNNNSTPTPNKQKEFYNDMYRGIQYAQIKREDQIVDYNQIPKVLNKYFPEKTPLTLEIGCGRGMFQNITEKYIGVDISYHALTHVTDKPKLAGSGESLPFKNNSFDFIFSLTSLEHFIDIEAGLKELERLLKPGGIASILSQLGIATLGP